MSWRNAPENFFSAVRGCPRPCARTNPWFRGQILGEKCAQEPTPGSAVKHCRFLDTGGGGGVPYRHRGARIVLVPFCRFLCGSVDSHDRRIIPPPELIPPTTSTIVTK